MFVWLAKCGICEEYGHLQLSHFCLWLRSEWQLFSPVGCTCSTTRVQAWGDKHQGKENMHTQLVQTILKPFSELCARVWNVCWAKGTNHSFRTMNMCAKSIIFLQLLTVMQYVRKIYSSSDKPPQKWCVPMLLYSWTLLLSWLTRCPSFRESVLSVCVCVLIVRP